MVSKKDLKDYKSLKQKKYRNELGLFVIEGEKSVVEALNSSLYVVATLSSDELFIQTHARATKIEQKEIDGISSLKNAPKTICIAKIPDNAPVDFNALKNQLVIILDNIQDPGNLGTIIRIADWFDVNHIICSNDTVDLYNSKTIQATMGSFLRINVTYTELETFIIDYKKATQLPVYATTLNGENIYQTKLSNNGAFVVGNEGKGISEAVINCCTNMLTIPKFGKAESLNAGIATALICGEFKSLKYKD